MKTTVLSIIANFLLGLFAAAYLVTCICLFVLVMLDRGITIWGVELSVGILASLFMFLMAIVLTFMGYLIARSSRFNSKIDEMFK